MKNLKYILLAIGGVVVAWLLRVCFDNSFLRLIYTVVGFPLIAIGGISAAIMCHGESVDNDRPAKLKKLVEPTIVAMYKNGKTDADVHWYLKAQIGKHQEYFGGYFEACCGRGYFMLTEQWPIFA